MVRTELADRKLQRSGRNETVAPGPGKGWFASIDLVSSWLLDLSYQLPPDPPPPDLPPPNELPPLDELEPEPEE